MKGVTLCGAVPPVFGWARLVRGGIESLPYGGYDRSRMVIHVHSAKYPSLIEEHPL
jgi:hypothetical protein